MVVGFTSNTSITYTPYAGASRLAVFWGRSDGHVAHPRGVSGVHGSGVMHACIGGGGVIFDLVRSRQRYLFAVVSPWKDSIGFMKVVVRYYTPYTI